MIKKSQRIWIIFVGLFIALVAAFAVPKTEDKEVHAAADLTISTVSQLETFRNNVNNGNTYSGQTVELAADLDLSGISNWTPIGNTLDHPFEGTFNGGRHTISGMKTNIAGSGINVCAGLFGYTNNAVVTGVGVVGCNINVSAQSAITGGLIGRMDDGRVANCYVTGIVSNESFSAAGEGGYIGYFIGQLNSGMLTCCYAAGGTGNAFGPTSGSATLHYGPLLGYNNSGKVYESYFPDTLHFVMSGNRTSCNAGTFKTEGQFASGEVTYLLNGSYTPANSVWYQSIDNDLSPHDDFPSFNNSRGKVYGAYKCGQGNTRYYTNTDPAAVSDDQWYPSLTSHSFDNNGFCTRCGAYQACTGEGTSSSPYQIGNTGQLYWFAAVVNNELDKCASPPAQRNTAACGILTDDIVINEDISSASARLWTPIGIDNNSANYYTGTFNGNNHTISGMKVNITGATGYVYAGLFGYTYSPAKIQNVGIINSVVNASGSSTVYAGGLVGYTYSATITNSYSEGVVTATGSGGEVYIGGFAGVSQNNTIISNCHSSGTINAKNTSSALLYAGGLVGYGDTSASITNCYSTCSVTSNDTGTGDHRFGGLAGCVRSNISDSYATGDVNVVTKGTIVAGGFTGQSYGTISGSYATGNVVSSSDTTSEILYASGFVGRQESGTISECYATGTASATNTKTGSISGIQCRVSAGGFAAISCNLTKCYATGDVNGTGPNEVHAGGLVGRQYSNSTKLENCYATGNVTGNHTANYNSATVGGLVGKLHNANTNSVTYCYAIGNVTASGTGTRYYGQLFGSASSSAITGSLYYLSTSTASGSAQQTAGTSKTSAQFASGEVTYLLNGSTSTGNLAWYQSIDNGVGPDAYPCFEEERGIVYYSTPCGKSAPSYSNYNRGSATSHSFDSNGFCTNCGAYEPCTGSGTSGSPYQIGNAGNLYWFACVVNNDTLNCEDYYASNSRNAAACATLTADITINNDINSESARLWKPIGAINTNADGYQGTFNGNNHTISGMKVNIACVTNSVTVAGLFGRTQGAKIYDVTINDGSVDVHASTGYVSAGALVGNLYNSSHVKNCHANNVSITGSATGTNAVRAGGLVAINQSNSGLGIENSSASGSVTATGPAPNYAGGLVAHQNDASPTTNSYADVNITATSSGEVWAGGLIAYQSSNTTISNCYAGGSVTATSSTGGGNIGGFAGVSQNNSIISNCHCTGNVSADGGGNIGGFVGTLISSGATERCYSTGNVIAQGKAYLRTGGFVGQVETACDVYDCYSQGNVQSNSPSATDGDNSAGGFVGLVWDRYSGTRRITRCYSSGTVSLQSNRQKYGGKFQGSGATIDGTNGCIYCSNQSISYSGAGSNTTNTAGTEKTAAQFASGEVTYLLNGSVSGGTTWYQSIDNELSPHDSYPLLDTGRGIVYSSTPCTQSSPLYSNYNKGSATSHSFDGNGFCTNCGAYEPCTGSGTSGSPYQIGNAGQLYWFACVVNNDSVNCEDYYASNSRNASACATLTADITINDDISSASARLWTPIGKDDTTANRYTGTFNGNNHTISGMKVDITGATSNVYAGLFGYTYGSSAKIQNVGLVNSGVNASGSSTVYAGGLVGEQYSGTITNSYATGDVNATSTGSGAVYAGGLVGKQYSGIISNSYATGDVTATSSGYAYAGRLMGSNSGTVTNLYYLSTSSVSGKTLTNVGTSKTPAQFASGEVTYLLNGSVSGGTTWYQSIDNELSPHDSYPLLSSERGTVYSGYRCTGSTREYSNINNLRPSANQGHDFTDNNGFCIYCDAYQSCSGAGTSASPYQIGNAGQLYWFACVVNGGDDLTDKCENPPSRNTSVYATLTEDIEINESLSSESARLWTPIGTLRGNVSLDGYENAYKGTFDGQNYTISGMKVDITGATSYFCAGLFGGIDSGTIQNVGILNSSIRCQNSVDVSAGGLIGAVASIDHTKSSNIINCYSDVMINVQGSTSYHTFRVGGLLGGIFDCCNVTNSYATGDINVTGSGGFVFAGGLYGSEENSSDGTITINNCYATGDAIATDLGVYAGGFVGARAMSGAASNINNAYATGNVIATGSQGIAAGGFAGGQACGSSSDTCDISNVYAVGDVTASGSDTCYVGRLVGRSELATVTNSYYLSTSSISGATPTDLGTSKTEAEFNSGEVTYLLNQGQELTWYQSVDNELSPHDPYPLFDSDRGIVYNGYKCNSSTLSYSNKELHAEPNNPNHDFTDNNGFCRICDAYQAPATGTGASGSPYQITNAGQLYWFAAVVNNDLDKCADAPAQQNLSAYGKLMNDIVINEDLSSANARLWTPIANDTSASNVNYYKGTFDGQNHTISGMKVDITGVSGYVYAGLFGKTQTMTIANIGIVNSSVNVSGSESYTYAGGLIGYQNHVLNNCYADVEVTVSCSSGYSYAGGLIGYHYANVTNSYATGNVTATTTGSSNIYVGGLAGYKGGGSLTSSYATGAVNTTGSRFVDAGGLIGYNSSGTMTDCYATGAVNATATDSNNLYAGGLIGYQNSSVQKSYATGNVTAQQTGTGYAYVGGLSGYINSNSIIECYATGNVTGNNNNGKASYVGGLLGIQISGTSITKSYATGNVTAGADSNSNGYKYAGGLVGQMTSSIINNAYATGTVIAKNSDSSNKYAGGLVGEQFGSSSIISNTYAIGDVVVSGSGGKRVGKLVGYQNGSATTVNNSYYLNSSAIPTSGVTTLTVGTSKTEAQFNSGEETYLLNQGQELNWYQSIDNGASPLDPYPLLDSTRGIVYKGCNEGASTSSDVYYSNSPDTTHTFDADGFCQYCGAYQSCTGAGTSASPYQIGNAGQLYWFAAVVNNALDKCASPPAQRKTNAYGTLTDDIVINDDISSASARLWTPIGKTNSSSDYYKGTFNGNNHTISGMKVNITGAAGNVYAGLFGYTYGATIQNVGVINSVVNIPSSTSYVCAGGLVGYTSAGTTTNCSTNLPVEITNSSNSDANVGGLVGYNSGTLQNCFAQGNVSNNGSSYKYTGGLIGRGSATNCYATGDVDVGTSNMEYTGGLVGNGSATNCYATGNVTVKSSYQSFNTGGLSGYGSATNCYATGNVEAEYTGSSSGDFYTGGLVGWTTGAIRNSYSTGDVEAKSSGSANVIVGGLIGRQNTGNSVFNGYSMSNITVAGTGTGAKYVGKVIGQQNSGTATDLYYLSTSTITNNTTAGTYTDNTSSLSGATSKTATEFSNFAVKDLLQNYVNNSLSSLGLSSWVQTQDKPEFSWDDHELTVNLSWGNLTFAYDPEEDTWALPEGDEGENVVAFVNESNGAKLRYNAVFDIASGLSGITGVTTHSSGDVTYQGATWPMVNSSDMTVSTNSRNTTLTISGTPSGGGFDRTTPSSPMEIGVITMTISG